jgi:alpha-ribazole phosphatase
MSYGFNGCASGEVAALKTLDLYLVRHGPPDCPPGLVYGADVGASLPGIETLAKNAALLPADAHWFTSPYTRAVDTAFALRGAAGQTMRAPIDVLPGFAEQNFGDWAGHRHSALLQDPDSGFSAYRRDPAGVTPPNGESIAMHEVRVRKALDDLVAKLSEHSASARQSAIVVCHGGPIRALWAAATDRAMADVLEDKQFRCQYLSITHITVDVANSAVIGINPVGFNRLPRGTAASPDTHVL